MAVAVPVSVAATFLLSFLTGARDNGQPSSLLSNIYIYIHCLWAPLRVGCVFDVSPSLYRPCAAAVILLLCLFVFFVLKSEGGLDLHAACLPREAAGER